MAIVGSHERIGLVSDVHANASALAAVFAALDRAGVDRVICLGDTVGYSTEPNECVAMIRARCDLVLAGNHDRAAVGTLDASDFPPRAKQIIGWTRRVLEREHAAYLKTLHFFATIDDEVSAVHGTFAPEPNDRYHLTKPRIATNFAALAMRGIRIGLFGHTHQPVVHVEGGGSITGTGIVGLPAGRRYLINPGSVGQSRDGDPRAAFAILDRGAARIEFARV